MSRKSFEWKQKKFDEQSGLCYYCSCEMLLLEKQAKRKNYPSNMATIEHLISKLNPLRQHSNGNREKRLVLACYSCNQKKCIEEVSRLTLEKRRERSLRYPKKHLEKELINENCN